MEQDIAELREIVNKSKDDGVFNKDAEISFIALACYFEAYFKNQFAAIVNICPMILSNLFNQRPDITIRVKDIALFNYDISDKIGFIIAEQFDFGTASLYRDLLLVTPFSKDNTIQYNELLSQRNLLVHHGGIYTTKYLNQNGLKTREDIFFNSLIIKKDVFLKWYSFVLELASKTSTACYTAIKKYIEENAITFDTNQMETLEAFLWSE